LHDRFALSILFGPVLGCAPIGRKQRVNSTRAAKRPRQKFRVTAVGGERFSSIGFEFGEPDFGSTERADPFSGLKQCFGDFPSGVPRRSHHRNEVGLHELPPPLSIGNTPVLQFPDVSVC
jgi:hypothetical protein